MRLFAATAIAVLALFLIAARGLRFVLERTRRQGGSVTQVGGWRVSPDASVRAVRTFGRVHLIYERGRESVLLESLESTIYEQRAGLAPAEPVRLAVATTQDPHPRSQVAKA